MPQVPLPTHHSHVDTLCLRFHCPPTTAMWIRFATAHPPQPAAVEVAVVRAGAAGVAVLVRWNRVRLVGGYLELAVGVWQRKPRHLLKVVSEASRVSVGGDEDDLKRLAGRV